MHRRGLGAWPHPGIVLLFLCLLVGPAAALPGPPCSGDLDRDGDQDGTDARTLSAEFGQSGCGGGCLGDLDLDGAVGAGDVTLFAPDLGRADCPQPTPAPGVYTFQPAFVPGLGESQVVEFNPDGSYAVVLESTNMVRLYDWATGSAAAFDLTPAEGTLWWQDAAFTPDGSGAVLVGFVLTAAGQEGVVFRLDDAAWRQFQAGQGDAAAVIVQETAATGSAPYLAVEYPRVPGGLPVILERGGSFSTGYTAVLREFDPGSGKFGRLLGAAGSSVGCDDIAFVDDAVGAPGILVVCGLSGSDLLYYTDGPGGATWQYPGSPAMGNVVRAAARPAGDYALFVEWPARRAHRFEGGVVRPDSLGFPNHAIWGVEFQQDGRRALLFGRAGGFPLRGTLIEYRHDEYACASLPDDCGLTDVSIQNFAQPPYMATSSTYLLDAAFRPGCDGGLLVGGDSTRGLLVEFQIDGQRMCR